MYTMRRANEIRSMDAIDELAGVPAKVKPEEIKLAKQVISNFEGELDLADYTDAYQEELQRIIDAKIAGEEVVATEEQAPPKVVNLMDALRQSLDRVSDGEEENREGRRGSIRQGEGGAREETRPRIDPVVGSSVKSTNQVFLAGRELVENLLAHEFAVVPAPAEWSGSPDRSPRCPPARDQADAPA